VAVIDFDVRTRNHTNYRRLPDVPLERYGPVPGQRSRVRIAVDPGGITWLINSGHRIYHGTGTVWTHVGGVATDIQVGAHGTLWMIGTTPLAGVYALYRWKGND
jgi:hypothetical protein